MVERSIRVLVIEDQPDIQIVLTRMLQAAGFEVALAGDGDAGLALALREPFDAVVLDLMMPRMLGYEVIQHLRAAPATADLPIVVLSAKTYASDQRKALEMGASIFVPKPPQQAELVAALRQVTQRTTVRFWGVRGSIASPGPDTVRYGGNTPCVAVTRAGRQLILDAGTGLRALGVALQARSRGQAQSIDLLISHTHWDHIQGFPFFVPAYMPANQIRVYGPRSADKPLEKVQRGQMDPEYFPVALGDMAAQIQVHEYRGESFDIAGFRVTAAYLNHPGATLGYRLEDAGLVITYATDTEPYRRHLPATSPSAQAAEFALDLDRELVELARNADLMIADSQYFPDEYPRKMGWGHTCYTDAVEIALQAGVRHLVLFSHDPMHSDDMVDAKLAHCRRIVEERGSDMRVTAASERESVYIAATDLPASS